MNLKFNHSTTFDCNNQLKKILDDYFQTKSTKAKLDVEWFYNGKLLKKKNK